MHDELKHAVIDVLERNLAECEDDAQHAIGLSSTTEAQARKRQALKSLYAVKKILYPVKE